MGPPLQQHSTIVSAPGQPAYTLYTCKDVLLFSRYLFTLFLTLLTSLPKQGLGVRSNKSILHDFFELFVVCCMCNVFFSLLSVYCVQLLEYAISLVVLFTCHFCVIYYCTCERNKWRWRCASVM